MIENINTEVETTNLLLRPYAVEYVPEYNSWMESEWLRDMTASERLSLEEEYSAQQEWINDPQKLTFMVFYRNNASKNIKSTDGMIGDVNIFILDDDESEKYALPNSKLDGIPKCAEVMVMIAKEAYHRKGLAQETVLAIMKYSAEKLGIRRFVAKISDSNQPSLSLFERKLCFRVTKHYDWCSETHLTFEISDSSDIVLNYNLRDTRDDK